MRIVNYECMLVFDCCVPMPMPMRLLSFCADMFMIVMFTVYMLMLVIEFTMHMNELRFTIGRPK